MTHHEITAALPTIIEAVIAQPEGACGYALVLTHDGSTAGKHHVAAVGCLHCMAEAIAHVMYHEDSLREAVSEILGEMIQLDEAARGNA